MSTKRIVTAMMLGAFVSSVVHAQTLEDCMKSAADKLADVQTQEVMRDQGCTTPPAQYLEDITFVGFLVHDCQAEVCWKVLRDRVITDAVVSRVGAGGSRHEFQGPTYVPDKTRATGVCVHVEARGPYNEAGGVGFQKIAITVTTRHVPTGPEMIEIASECVKSGARPR